MMLLLSILLAVLGYAFYRVSMSAESLDGIIISGFLSFALFLWSFMAFINFF